MKRSVSDDDMRDNDDRGKRHRGSRPEIRMLVPSRVRLCISVPFICMPNMLTFCTYTKDATFQYGYRYTDERPRMFCMLYGRKFCVYYA